MAGRASEMVADRNLVSVARSYASESGWAFERGQGAGGVLTFSTSVSVQLSLHSD